MFLSVRKISRDVYDTQYVSTAGEVNLSDFLVHACN